MDKILQLIIEDFQNKKPSAEYQLVQQKVCEAESVFMNSLGKEQKKEYFKFDFIESELYIAEFNEFAKFLLENLKNYFKEK